MNKNMKLVVLACVLMGAVAAQGETLPQVVQSVDNTIRASAEQNRKAVVQLGSQMMQEREQKQQKEAAARDKKLVRDAKAQQAELRNSVQGTNYVATTYQAGPKYEVLGDPFEGHPAFERGTTKERCDKAGGDPKNKDCQFIQRMKDMRGPYYVKGSDSYGD